MFTAAEERAASGRPEALRNLALLELLYGSGLRASELVTLPDFLPGLGTLYVDPATLPAGPFLGYDHDGKLSATIYMTPLEDLEGGQAFDDLALGRDSVASVDIYHNAGHPGVEKPHVHVVLYHDADAKARLAE